MILGKTVFLRALGLGIVAAGLGLSAPANAADLFSIGDIEALNDGAYVERVDGSGSGFGNVFNVFSQYGGGSTNPDTVGFNTSASGQVDNTSGGGNNQDLPISSVPLVTRDFDMMGDIDYALFTFNANQTSTSITFDALRLVAHNEASITSTDPLATDPFPTVADSSIVWELSGMDIVVGADNSVGDPTTGNGAPDALLYIPLSLFVANADFGTPDSLNLLTLISSNPDGSGGSDSWSVATDLAAERNLQDVPTPALLPGLVGMGVAAFRKRKQQSNAA